MNDLAKSVFATHYHYLLKAQNFHWNVTGPDFLEYHELFERIYCELEDHTDEFAEQLRTLGIYVPATLKEFAELSILQDPPQYESKEEMVECLHKDSSTILKALLELYKQAETAQEHGFSSFLAERMSAHGKHGWQLYSSLI
jgi:starvation-inducible DNA-binding protein